MFKSSVDKIFQMSESEGEHDNVEQSGDHAKEPIEKNQFNLDDSADDEKVRTCFP